MVLNWREKAAIAIARVIGGPAVAKALAAVSVRVDDSRGWVREGAGRHDRNAAEIQQLYEDALTAWRKNPIAKRIIDITSDYCLGDGIRPKAAGEIGKFVSRWWEHPQNHMDLRMPDLSDELSRAGDLFLTLHRNDADGMSYVRVVPKDSILRIETAANDWERELAYYERRDTDEPRRWAAAGAPGSETEAAVMCHYSVNRPVGALMGESDLATLIPWLLRYSRMLEDRVRMHWAARSFLWLVTVPSSKIKDKTEAYRTPPEAGSVIVKDDGEKWEAEAPNVQAGDARHDLMAVRRMIQAGSYPPHWMSEGEDINLATAQAMNDPSIRHLRRRQKYIRYMVIDLAHTAYSRAYAAGKVRKQPDASVIDADLPDISREDNKDLAEAAKELGQALALIQRQVLGKPAPTFVRWALGLISKFMGEPLEEKVLDLILEEASPLTPLTPSAPDAGSGQGGSGDGDGTGNESPGDAE